MTEGDRVTPPTTVKVTHLPTGFAVTIDSNGGGYESVPRIIARAKRVLAVRLAARQTAWREVFVYDVPEDQPYPHELMPLRQPAAVTHADLQRCSDSGAWQADVAAARQAVREGIERLHAPRRAREVISWTLPGDPARPAGTGATPRPK